MCSRINPTPLCTAESWYRVRAVRFSGGTHFSAAIIACHDIVLFRVFHSCPGIVRGPTLVRALSSGKEPHYYNKRDDRIG